MYYKILAILAGIAITFAVDVNKVAAQSQTNQQNLIKVEKIVIQGNTVFSDAELEKAFTPIISETVHLERLFQIRTQIEQFYLDHGYISSGAFLPRQKLENGNLVIKVVEGSLSLIEIEGLSKLSEKYIKARLPKLEKPFRINNLTQALKRLEEDPLIKTIEGELKKLEPGKNLLILNIEENKSILVKLKFANTFSPTIGNFGGGTTVLSQNLLGFGDHLSTNYTKTEGLDSYGVSYSVPVNATGGRLTFDYNNTDSELIEEAISAFDIQADFESYKLLIRQPIINNETEKLTFSVGLEKLRSETFVAKDISFPFVDGLEDGVSKISPLRIAQEYSKRGSSSLIAAQSQFNLGLDLFDATINETTGIDAAFWSWIGNIQWIKVFDGDGNWQFRTSLTTQLTPDQLLPLEQLTVGGLGSVRGYRQNLIVGDNGIIAIAEGQIPIIKSQRWGNIDLVPFADFGTVWSNYSDPNNTQTNTLASFGLELSYQMKEILDAKVFYGIPLVETEDFGASATEERWGFSISVVPLRF